ncbi:MAG: hypothetical protein ACK4L7_10910, partial [Flavobacteriales bacterium]
VQWYMLGANINIGVDATPPFSLRTFEVIDGVWAEYRDREAQDFFLGIRLGQVPIHDAGCNGFFGLADGQDVGSPVAVRAWVRNYGNQPTGAIDVSYRFGTGPVVTQPYTGPAIPPGQQQLHTFTSYFVPSEDATGQLCAWTTMANDVITANDTACVLINTYVGLAELERAALRLWPVPAGDQLWVEGLPPGPWQARLADAGGRMVRSMRMPGGAPAMVAVGDLDAGAYVLLIEGKHARRALPLLVQR